MLVNLVNPRYEESQTSKDEEGQPIRGYKPEYLSMFNLSRDVFRRLQEGDPTWVHDVPPNVALLICQRHLLGYDPEKFAESVDVPPPA